MECDLRNRNLQVLSGFRLKKVFSGSYPWVKARMILFYLPIEKSLRRIINFTSLVKK